MAQLDTRGIVSGAAQGFGLAQDYIDTDRRRDREDELMEWEKADRQTRAQDRRRTIGIQDEQLEWQRENQEFQSRQNNWAEFQQDFQPIMANLQTRGELTPEEWSVVGKGVKNFPGRLPADLSNMWRAQQAETILPTIQQLMTDPNSVSDEQIDSLENMPVPLHHAIEPEQGEALAIVGDLMDPETETNMRSPQVIEAANRIFGPRLGEGKRIASMMPGREPGTLVFELEVTGEDGQARRAPMTRNRGTVEDEDNEVLQVPVADLMNELQDAMAIKATFDQNPEAAQRVMQFAVSQGYVQQGQREDTFDIRELPNGRYGQFNTRTGEIVRELSAEEVADGGGGSGGGGGFGGVSGKDARLWYDNINDIISNAFEVKTDDLGIPIDDGSAGYEKTVAYSSLAAQLWRNSQAGENGQLISPQEAFDRVDQVARGYVLSRSEAEEMAMQQFAKDGNESPDQTAVRQMADEILKAQYQSLQSELFPEQGDNWIAVDEGTSKEYRDNLTMADQDWLDPSSMPGQGPKGPLLMPGQNWNAPMLTPEQQQGGGGSPNLPDQKALLAGDNPQGGGRAGLSNPPRPLGGRELESETPVGRRVEQVGNLSSNITGLVNDAALYVGDAAESTGQVIRQAVAGIPERVDQNVRYADWVSQVKKFIGGGYYLQPWKDQSDDEHAANNQIISFIESGRGKQLLSNNGRMQKIFTQDPQGFMAAAQQGLQPEQIEQYLIQQGRVAPRSNPVPVE